MNEAPSQFGEVIRKWIASAVESPKNYVHASWAALLSVANVLVELLDASFLADISRIKEATIESIEANSKKQQADADLRVAEAAQAANIATLPKRSDAMARAESRRIAAEAAKTEAEAEAIQMDAETRRAEAIANGKARLIEAIYKLRQEGGELFFSREEIERLLR